MPGVLDQWVKGVDEAGDDRAEPAGELSGQEVHGHHRQCDERHIGAPPCPQLGP